MKRKLYKILFPILITSIILPISSCSFIQGLFGKNEEEGKNLKITVLSDPVARTPLSGILVFITTPESKGLEGTTITGTDGIADFGNINLNYIDISFAYETIGGTDIYRGIETIQNVPVGELTYYYYPGCSNEPLASINVQLSNLPPDFSETYIQPVDSYSTDISGYHGNIDIHDCSLQDDGKLTLLATVEDSTYNTTNYGFLTDLDPVNNSIYNIPLDFTPTTLSFNSTTLVDFVGMDAYRKGVYFFLGDKFFNPQVYSDTFQVLDQFPLSTNPGDSFEAYALGEEEVIPNLESRDFMITDMYYSMPQGQIYFDIPEYRVESIEYDPAGRSCNWTTTGNHPSIDATILWLIHNEYSNDQSTIFEWFIYADPSSNPLTIPQLPQEITDWFDPNNLSYLELIKYDIVEINGYNEVLDVLTGKIDLQSSSTFSASYKKYFNLESRGLYGGSQRIRRKIIAP